MRRGEVVSTPFEHVSIAATMRTRFGVDTLGPRMDAARDLAACIDPALVDNPAPPPRALHTVELALSQTRLSGAASSSQPEMEQALSGGRLPPELVDGRSDEDRFQGWLRHAQELEAVKVRG